MSSLSPAHRVAVSLLLLGIGVGGFVWMGTPEVPTRPPEERKAPVVKTAIAQDHKDGIQFLVDGVVVPFRQIEIAAQVSGRIEFKAEQCRTGRAVKKGDLLVRIEQSDYDLEVKRLKEEVTQADAMINELDVELETADNQIASAREQLVIDLRQLERNKDLLSRQAASDSEVDSARRTELTTRNSLQTLLDQKSLLARRRLRLESAKVLGQANLEKAELALSRTEIRSPLDGMVVNENVEQDGYIQAGSTVISLQDTSSLDVTCKLHMRQMHWLWQGQAESKLESVDALTQAYDFPETLATVIYDLGGRTYEWKGVVDRYDGAGIDNQTRMVPCRVHVNDPLAVTASDSERSATENPPTLMTGMFVKVRVDARPPISLVRLPQEAIQPGNAIWTVDEGKLKRKKVSIANSNAEFVVAYQQEGGLQAGDAVVVSPLATPIEGLEVQKFSELDLTKKPGGGRPGGSWGGGKPGGGRPGGGAPAGDNKPAGKPLPRKEVASQ
jgi:RND family efflux transporter MFP subunit